MTGRQKLVLKQTTLTKGVGTCNPAMTGRQKTDLNQTCFE
ncbi:uncharacterized protein G2W53_001073 [Senna tora]|uniref:Uncharacterized protein n=1 Tax=Senna tora TaxID=362788 RepID=A0A834XJ06_9FABA|nr:uncharacterized protein G2W53_001073 [Senna tora]